MPPRSQTENPSAVQDRLLQMLETVQVDHGAEAPADDDAADAACPHCKSTGSWGTSPWCPKCGFYPKLNRVLEGVGEERIKSAPDAETKPTENDAAENQAECERDEAIEKTERGLTWLFVALLLFIPAATLSGLYFLGVDLNGVLMSAGLAARPSASTAEGPKEAEGVNGKSSPQTESKSIGQNDVVQATALSTSAAGTATGVSKRNKEFKPLGTHREDFSEFVIFGFTTNAGGELRSVLIAEFTDDGRGRFAGRLSTDETRDSLVALLKDELAKVRSSRPALACPYGANWVQPILRCRVAHDGWTYDKRINDGEIVGLYEETPR